MAGGGHIKGRGGAGDVVLVVGLGWVKLCGTEALREDRSELREPTLGTRPVTRAWRGGAAKHRCPEALRKHVQHRASARAAECMHSTYDSLSSYLNRI